MNQHGTLFAVFLFATFADCFTQPPVAQSPNPLSAINAVLDDWHKAAARADEERYFGHLTVDAVFLGTDATERWTRDDFRKWAHPYFAKGTAWSFKAKKRNVTVSADGKFAWFDEVLETEKLGPCRGSGVLQLDGKTWRISQYNLSLTIPNDAFTDVKRIVEASLEGRKPGQYFTIKVVDEETGRGVPLVELQTVNNIRYYTDSNGVAAFHEDGLMEQTIFFHIKSHGYEFPKDGFGYRGKALDVKAGASATLKIKRRNIAQRLYRVTGAGIYRDSVLIGDKAPVKDPLLNGQVFGSDSVVNTIYKGKLYWFWGDTNRPGYPLGNFNVPGATSVLPKDGGLDAELGVDLTYFVDEKGFAKKMAPMPGDGPTWIGGLVTLHDTSGRERMFAGYVKVRKFLEVYQHGLCEYNDGKQQFEKVVEFKEGAPIYPDGHTFKHVSDGVEHIYFANPFPITRVRADVDALKDLSQYESYSCLAPSSANHDGAVDRRPDGSANFAWKKNTAPTGPKEQAQLVRRGKLKAGEGPFHLNDPGSGQPITMGLGSVYWNDYRKRWVMIATQSGGISMLGEVWYAEADAPTGPWANPKKIVTHDKYSFYNPKQHPLFAKENGRLIFFEGTYTHTFSGNAEQTPRYDYNQIMYKLDLADARLGLPPPGAGR